jgi:MFS family permease
MSRQEAGSFDALGVSNYRILFVGTIGSFTGFFMSTVLQGVVAFELTGTNTAVGSAVFGQGLGMLLFSPIGGALADRLPKRRVVATGQMVSASVFATLGLMFSIGALRLTHLVVGAFIVGTAFGVLGPARQALAIDLVPDTLRGNAMALNNVANTASRVVGPFVTGLLLAYAWAGPAMAYATIAALYMTSATMLLFLPRSIVRDDVGETHVFEDLSAGFRYAWNHRRLRNYLAFFMAVMWIGFPHVTLIPGLLENVLGREAREVTDFYLASAVGALSASLYVARYADARRAPLLYSVMAIGFGISLVAIAHAPGYVTAVLAMLLVGASSGGFHALNGAVIARVTETAYMGRVMSLSMLAFAGFGLTALPLGMLADRLGEQDVLFGMGTAVFALSVGMSVVEWRDEAAR